MERDLNVGDIVDATVESISENGIFLLCRGHRGMVDVTELSWGDGRYSPSEFASVGQGVRVKIISTATSQFRASLRQVHPDRDPWRDPEVYRLGRRVLARVIRELEWGYVVRIAPGVSGVLIKGITVPVLKTGDEVNVEISRVDEEVRSIEVTLAR